MMGVKDSIGSSNAVERRSSDTARTLAFVRRCGRCLLGWSLTITSAMFMNTRYVTDYASCLCASKSRRMVGPEECDEKRIHALALALTLTRMD
mmetsp:Transcript_31913/g.39116  ORF Transcript_31913/g.39116 Transcript_31913/m.39116 type:complete len:93 (+) Transcript_31913:274-552(+)